MVILWLYRGYIVVILWLYRGYIVVILWSYRGYTAVILWLYCGYTVVIPWLYRGYTVAVPWLYRGCTVVIPWLFRGYTVVILLYNCYYISTLFGYYSLRQLSTSLKFECVQVLLLSQDTLKKFYTVYMKQTAIWADIF